MLEILSEVDTAARLGEPKRQMRAMAYLIIQARIRRKLLAADALCPAFASSHEGRTDSLSSGLRNHEPAFEVADAVRAAGIHNVADRELHEPDGLALVVERQDHFRGFMAVAREKALCVAAMLVERSVRPQGVPEPYPIGADRVLYGSDAATTPFAYPSAGWAAFRRLPLTETEFTTIANNLAPYMRDSGARQTRLNASSSGK